MNRNGLESAIEIPGKTEAVLANNVGLPSHVKSTKQETTENERGITPKNEDPASRGWVKRHVEPSDRCSAGKESLRGGKEDN